MITTYRTFRILGGFIMVNNTIAEITLNYKGNVYSFNYEFGNITADTAKFLFE